MRRRQVIKSTGALSLGLPLLAGQEENDEEEDTPENDTTENTTSRTKVIDLPTGEPDLPENRRVRLTFRRVEEPRETAPIVDVEENNITQIPSIGERAVPDWFSVVLEQEQFERLEEQAGTATDTPALVPHGFSLDYYDIFFKLETGFFELVKIRSGGAELAEDETGHPYKIIDEIPGAELADENEFEPGLLGKLDLSELSEEEHERISAALEDDEDER